MEEIETNGDKREQLIRLMVNHLLGSSYEFNLNYEEGMTKIDLYQYGSVMIADNSMDLSAHKKSAR